MLDKVVVVAEELEGRGLLFSYFKCGQQMDLNMGEAQTGQAVAREESIPVGLAFRTACWALE